MLLGYKLDGLVVFFAQHRHPHPITRDIRRDTIDVLIVISERRMEPYDIGIFECVGLDPARYDYLLLKSRMYARPVFGALAKALVECDADQGGPTSSNYALFPFKNIRRPVYPLDENV